jgi:hypothetical protein
MAKSAGRLPDGMRRVVGSARPGNLLLVRLSPFHEGLDRGMQRHAERRELLVHPGRDHGIDGAVHEPVPLELAQRDGEHPMADPLDCPLWLAARLLEC